MSRRGQAPTSEGTADMALVVHGDKLTLVLEIGGGDRAQVDMTPTHARKFAKTLTEAANLIDLGAAARIDRANELGESVVSIVVPKPKGVAS